MTTKANRTRESQKRIEEAKKAYGLAKDNGSLFIKFISMWAESPWILLASLAAMVACVVVLVL